MGRIGIMTAGGDCPGLNAVIRALTVRAGRGHGREVVGFLEGWRGLMEGLARPLDRDDVRGIMPLGGTMLGTSRLDPYLHGEGIDSVRPAMEAHQVECLVVVGGEGTLRTALRLHQEGLPVVGVPKTIDNDIAATDFTFGFHTAVQIATDAIDRLTTTAEAHNRVMLVEVMGRHSGWIAAYAGLAGGAEMILVPEVPYDLGEVAEVIRRRHREGRDYSIVVVAEGIPPPPGIDREQMRDAYGFPRLGGVSYDLSPILEERTGFETRVTVLGYIQRGGDPHRLRPGLRHPPGDCRRRPGRGRQGRGDGGRPGERHRPRRPGGGLCRGAPPRPRHLRGGPDLLRIGTGNLQSPA